MATFTRSVQDVRKELKYPDSMIVNIDETPMYFDMTTNKIINQKSANAVSVRSTGAEKRRLTVVLAATGDGQMLSPRAKGLLKTSLCLGKTVAKVHSLHTSSIWHYSGWIVSSAKGMDGWHPHDAMDQQNLSQVHWKQEITVGDGHCQCTLLQ